MRGVGVDEAKAGHGRFTLGAPLPERFAIRFLQGISRTSPPTILAQMSVCRPLSGRSLHEYLHFASRAQHRTERCRSMSLRLSGFYLEGAVPNRALSVKSLRDYLHFASRAQHRTNPCRSKSLRLSAWREAPYRCHGLGLPPAARHLIDVTVSAFHAARGTTIIIAPKAALPTPPKLAFLPYLHLYLCVFHSTPPPFSSKLIIHTSPSKLSATSP